VRVKAAKACSRLIRCCGSQPPGGLPLASARLTAAARPWNGLGLSTGKSEPNASGTRLSIMLRQA
jgi:hypothetical protein